MGLNFVEIPWLIGSSRGDAVSTVGLKGNLPWLYAMGIDAYRLGSRLGGMSDNPRMRIPGKTGVLGMDPQRRIRRELTAAHIGVDGPLPGWRRPGGRSAHSK